MRRLVNQFVRVFVERCPLTSRHTAQSHRRQLPSGSSRTRPLKSRGDLHSFGGICSPEAEADHEARSQPHSGLRQDPTTTSQAKATTTALETNDFHAQRAEPVKKQRTTRSTWSSVRRKTRDSKLT